MDGSYLWVEPSDWRVAEVRLLRDHETIGEVSIDAQRADDNLALQGDALAALRALTDLPEFADSYLGKVRPVYIDPPFNTGQTFDDYEDEVRPALRHHGCQPYGGSRGGRPEVLGAVTPTPYGHFYSMRRR